MEYSFFSFCGTAFISVVAPISVDIDPDSVEAFFIPKNVGIVINRDVWHHSLISINDNSQFFVIENEVPNNCKIQSISQKLVIRDYNCR
jgi:Ureidoglycolate hydrolase